MSSLTAAASVTCRQPKSNAVHKNNTPIGTCSQALHIRAPAGPKARLQSVHKNKTRGADAIANLLRAVASVGLAPHRSWPSACSRDRAFRRQRRTNSQVKKE
jgi:hypothetical protein